MGFQSASLLLICCFFPDFLSAVLLKTINILNNYAINNDFILKIHDKRLKIKDKHNGCTWVFKIFSI